MSKVLCHGAGQLQPRVSQGAEVSLGFARARTLELGRQPGPEMLRFAVGELVKQRDRPFRLLDFGHLAARVRVQYWQNR